MRIPIPSFGVENSGVCLDRNGVPVPCGCVRFEAHGAVFQLPRRLDLMSSLVVSVEWRCPGCGRSSLRFEAIVIGCCETRGGVFEATVIFMPGDGSGTAPEFRHLPN